MSKNSKAGLLPSPVRQELSELGNQIRMARRRRKLTIKTVAERAQCSELTVIRAEKGLPTISIGIYAKILYAMGLTSDISLWAKTDPQGNALEQNKLLKHKSKETYDVFD